ncbi:fibronectin type III domain-containing protein [Conexibacter sp. JD483]|uniref:fibronectin type III domain-containing protein n=1 Tax=unclassified Conexibacter TaxID=2627773 RepID=UPI0027215C09|nr:MULTISPECIES: fibronectin type III domain-containing protein [unclassified Conexibacter]MDO8187485.1 fibronectin type III domain-containing protein [Conexibacter sp. CPCC 205706]MDO8198719.1 fibronectin type III domain-containing protein [Conexibacter sp. CPCC 205762]MDR9372407.1 fibronectin type III domain-containing protein [Conexibacter sp. JD483]
MGRRGRTRALTALTMAVALLGALAATASAGTVTGVSARYQGSTRAGDVAEYVTLGFGLQSSLGTGQTITVRGPPGSDLTRTTSASYQLNLPGGSGLALNSFRLSDGNSTIVFTLPSTVTAPGAFELLLPGTTNPRAGGSYRWAVATSLDTAGESPAVTIDPRPLSALTVTGGDGQRTPVTQPFGEPLTVATSDDLGNPVVPAEPVDVTFTVSGGGSGGATFAGGAASATVRTDANGIATAPTLTANRAAGSFGVAVTSAGLTGTDATLRNGAGAATAITLAIAPSLLAAGSFESGRATVVIRDAYGNPVGPDDLTGGDPQLTIAGDATHSSLGWGEGFWRGDVYPPIGAGRSLVTASVDALSATQPFDAALKPLLGDPAISDLSATGATVGLPLDTRNAQTSYRVVYGTTTASGSESATLAAARDAVPNAVVTIPLSGLAPQTTYLYRVVATNAIGTTQGDVRSFTTPAAPVVPVDPPRGGGTPPGGGGAPAPPPADPAPRATGPARLSALRLAPRGFAVRGRSAGATLRFTLDRAATIRAKVEARLPGVRVRGRCVAPSRTARGAGCARWRAAGSLPLNGRAGANSVRFDGRLRGRALAPGRYRLTLTPAGGSATSVEFTVKR